MAKLGDVIKQWDGPPDPPRKRGRPRAKHTIRTVSELMRKCIDMILQHPELTQLEIADRLNCGITTIKKAQKIIVRDRLKVADGTAVAPNPPRLVNAGEVIEQLQENVEHGDVSPEEAKRILSRFIRSPNTHPKIRIAAIQAKQRIDYEAKTVHELGPGVPLSFQDAVDRVALLIQAVGPKVLHAAIQQAYSKAPDEETTNTQPTTAIVTPQTDIGETGHNPIIQDTQQRDGEG